MPFVSFNILVNPLRHGLDISLKTEVALTVGMIKFIMDRPDEKEGGENQYNEDYA